MVGLKKVLPHGPALFLSQPSHVGEHLGISFVCDLLQGRRLVLKQPVPQKACGRRQNPAIVMDKQRHDRCLSKVPAWRMTRHRDQYPRTPSGRSESLTAGIG